MSNPRRDTTRRYPNWCHDAYRHLLPGINWRSVLLCAAVAITLIAALNWAQAGSVTSLTIGRNGLTITQGDVGADPRILIVPQLTSDERDARIKAWLDFCQPVPVPNHDGVEVLHYSHAGCDVGRTQ